MFFLGVNKHNVGRVAERIVANELEQCGFRVSNLNKEGPSANADLLAAKGGSTLQIQVKGCVWDKCWWFRYGGWSEPVQNGSQKMFNSAKNDDFYKAEIVVLVCIKSVKEYTFLALPIEIAERGAQMNLDREYRTLRRNLQARRPGPVWITFDYIPQRRDIKEREQHEKRWNAELDLLRRYRDNWDCLSVG